MEAIIISGMPAVGKTTLAKILAERLNLKAMGGGDILKEMAAEKGYNISGEDWWDTKEGIRFLKEREANPDFDKDADRYLKKKIEAGNIVITSYTAPWITENGFKIWLSGSVERRAERMAKRDGIELKKSENVIRIRDGENIKLYKGLYGIEFGKDMKPFNIVIDTDGKLPEELADIIISELNKKVKGV